MTKTLPSKVHFPEMSAEHRGSLYFCSDSQVSANIIMTLVSGHYDSGQWSL